MGCDFHGFIEIGSVSAGEFDSLYAIQSRRPRHYDLFGALAGVRSAIQPLFPPRGIPSGLGVHGFSLCYKPIIKDTEALDWRGHSFVLPWEVGRATVFHDSASSRWAHHEQGYIKNDAMESPSWLLLSEIYQALAHASIEPGTLPAEYRFILQTMELAESVFGRPTRLVFWFDDV